MEKLDAKNVEYAKIAPRHEVIQTMFRKAGVMKITYVKTSEQFFHFCIKHTSLKHIAYLGGGGLIHYHDSGHFP